MIDKPFLKVESDICIDNMKSILQKLNIKWDYNYLFPELHPNSFSKIEHERLKEYYIELGKYKAYNNLFYQLDQKETNNEK